MSVNFRTFFGARSLITALLAGSCFATETVSAADSQGVEFFEKKIRPILVETCYDCHSQNAAKGIKGGLVVDTKEALLKGGDTGPAVVAGNLDKSLLIKAVRYTDENLQMPPKNKKLSPEQIADLEAWVKMGAPDPRTGTGPALSRFEQIMVDGKKHWAFQPVTSPAAPAVKNTRWVKSPIDAFVLTKLEAKGLSPSAPADKRTLIRRATFDLTGLPPEPEDVAAFVADRSANAFEKVVDRLLASPQYGERWGRHWLDVARYADTKGYLAGGEERRFPYSYTYRDYVINAFNKDLPYDRFVMEQIAGDQLVTGDDKSALAAMGFITLGRRFLNNQPDIIDDRIDVISRGLQGITVACARCHDHKYDPIPTKDYYSLYSILASSKEPDVKPLLGIKAPEKENKEYLAEREKREETLKKFREENIVKGLAKARASTPEYLLVAMDARKDPNAVDRLAREKKLETLVVRRWMKSLAEWEKNKSPIFAPWFQFAALGKEGFAAGASGVASSVATDSTVNPLIAKAFAGAAPASLREVAERYGKVLSEIDTKWMEASKGGAKQLADASQEALRQVFYAADAPPNLVDKDQEELIDDVRPRLRELKAKIDELDATHPGAPPRGMALEEGQPQNVRVFIRGNPGNRGPEAPRQFLEILTPGKREPYKQGSGRLELAKAIASKDNPLTARVFVNRVWRLHFGNGLVRTPSDFGVRADPPTHPELLDYLASQFMQNGWSVKKLHKMIMMTSVYQQSSDEDPKLAKKYADIDSANFLLWRMNRHRLEFEAMRDTMLKVAGQLDLTSGGLPIELTTEPTIPRRTVYGFIDRQNLPAMFRTFDFANPDSSSPQRFSTTVPQQALFLMNNSFLVEQARHFVTRKDVTAITDEDKRIQRMYQIAYQRQASPDEVKMAKQFLAKAASALPVEPEKPIWQNGYGRYDEAAKRVAQFTLLPQLVGGVWQGGPQLPDTKLAYTSLSANGGHTGNNPDNQVIRRWTAPQDGILSITGTLSHDTNKGDGVRGRIVSSRTGELGQWVAFNRKVPTPVAKVEVKKGDTIDFVTDCRTETSFDSFGWAPKLSYSEVTGAAMAGGRRTWDAQKDFSGPKTEPVKPLDAWEKYAQAILLSNELVFVD